MEECGSPYEQYQEVIAKIVISRDEYCHRTDGYSATCDFLMIVEGGKFQGQDKEEAYCKLLSIKGQPKKVPNERVPPSNFNYSKPKECLALEVVPEINYGKDWKAKK